MDMHHHDHCAPDCDDQLPTFAHVGRGLKGDTSFVELVHDTCDTTILQGWSEDSATGERHSEWITQNINGGILKYQYNLRPYTVPRTFTITFIYRKPGHDKEHECEWSWTTPAIPYIWTVDNEDGSVSEKPDHIVGSGVATLFIRASKDDEWNERLVYPIDPSTGEPYPREYFNSPEALEPWSATITFGLDEDSDIKIPNLDDIAKIVGTTPEKIIEIIKKEAVVFPDFADADNICDYINRKNDDLLDHVHKDLGFEKTGADGDDHGWTNEFGGYKNVKEYIDALGSHIDNLYEILNDLVTHIYGANLVATNETQDTIDPSKNYKISWPTTPGSGKIPVGNINVLSNTGSHAILTHATGSGNELTGDIKAE